MHRLRISTTAPSGTGGTDGGSVVLGTGAELNPVILGQPAVSGSAMVLPPRVVSGSVAWTIEWYVGEMHTANGSGTLAATGLLATFTPEHTMRQVWAKCSATVNGSPVAYYSARQWVHPSVGLTADNAGCPTWTAHTSDPATASAWSATTLYKCGDVVTHAAGSWFAQDAYCYGVTPGTDAAKWTQITATLYLDTSAGTNGSGTAGSPFNDPYEFQIRASSWISAGTKAAAGTLFLFKRGTTVPIQINAMNNVSARVYMLGCYGTSGARPILTPALSQTYLTALSIFAPASAVVAVGRYYLNGWRMVDLEVDGKNRYFLNVATASITGTFSAAQSATLGGYAGTIESVGVHNTSTTYVVFTMTSRDEFVGVSAALVSGTGSATMTVDAVTGITSIAGGNGTTSSDAARDLGARSIYAHHCAGFGFVWRGGTNGNLLGAFATECQVTHSCQAINQGSGGLNFDHFDRSRYFFNTLDENGQANAIGNHQSYGSYANDGAILFTKFHNARAGGKTYGNHAYIHHGDAGNVDLAWNFVDGCPSGFGFNDGYPTAEGTENMHDVRVFSNHLRGCLGVVGSVAIDITSVVRLTFANNVIEDANPSFIYGWRAVGGGVPGATDTTLTDAVVSGNTFVRASIVFGDYGVIKGNLVQNLRSHNNVSIEYSTYYLPFNWSSTIPLAEIDGSSHNSAYRADSGAVVNYGTDAAPVTYTTLAALHAAHAELELTSLTGNPLLTNITAGVVNALPQSGSPLIAAGIDMRRYTGIGCDYAGVARPDVPAIGAREPA